MNEQQNTIFFSPVSTNTVFIRLNWLLDPFFPFRFTYYRHAYPTLAGVLKSSSVILKPLNPSVVELLFRNAHLCTELFFWCQNILIFFSFQPVGLKGSEGILRLGQVIRRESKSRSAGISIFDSAVYYLICPLCSCNSYGFDAFLSVIAMCEISVYLHIITIID